MTINTLWQIGSLFQYSVPCLLGLQIRLTAMAANCRPILKTIVVQRSPSSHALATTSHTARVQLLQERANNVTACADLYFTDRVHQRVVHIQLNKKGGSL